MSVAALRPLGERIAALIAAQGPISVAQYMTLALHDAQSGYYATRQPLGRDFTTAPEISQMFGEMLGLWCAQVWHDQGRPKSVRLVELGPGRGTLMADALRAAKAVPDFRAALEVVLVEASPALTAIQQKTLAGCDVPLSWQTHFPDGFADRPLFVLANEFFDALPVRQYVKTAKAWHERMVVAEDGGLAFALAPLPTPPAAIPADRAGAPEGGVYEVSAASLALAGEIARAVAAKGGAALFVDYGHDGTGFGETLQAMRDGRPVGVLDDPGANDLSAHVDFAALADAARRGGAMVSGPRPQGAFLAALGLSARAERLIAANPGEAGAVRAAAHRLLDPAAMGDLFKALALLPPGAHTPPGF